MSSGSPVPEDAQPFRISFVCTGNICRSPMAEVVLREQVRRAGLESRVSVESAGTGDWHVGEQADSRTIDALAGRGYDGTQHRARQFESASFPELDLIVVFDRSQDRILRNWAPTETDAAKVRMLLGFDPGMSALGDVQDPYYSGPEMFESVLMTIERATAALFRQLAPALRPPST